MVQIDCLVAFLRVFPSLLQQTHHLLTRGNNGQHLENFVSKRHPNNREREEDNRTMSEQPGGIQPMAFEKNPPAPGEEYEEIREQVRSFPCPLTLTSRAGRVVGLVLARR